jgi:hypothetical protein
MACDTRLAGLQGIFVGQKLTRGTIVAIGQWSGLGQGNSDQDGSHHARQNDTHLFHRHASSATIVSITPNILRRHSTQTTSMCAKTSTTYVENRENKQATYVVNLGLLVLNSPRSKGTDPGRRHTRESSLSQSRLWVVSILLILINTDEESLAISNFALHAVHPSGCAPRHVVAV